MPCSSSTASWCDFADRLIAKSFKMAKYDQKSTLKAKHVKGAVHNMLRGDLRNVRARRGREGAHQVREQRVRGVKRAAPLVSQLAHSRLP